MNIYRRIYENNHGPIPKDENGRSYEIHHIDGNHSNNHIDNLICVSIQEHYDIHYKQGDWAACSLITSRMNISPEEQSRLASELVRKSVAEGTHNFLGGEVSRRSNAKRITNGTHNLLGKNNPTHERVINGTHNFQDREWARERTRKRIESGNHNFFSDHPTKQKVSCPHCNKVGSRPQMLQWHFDNCKSKISTQQSSS